MDDQIILELIGYVGSALIGLSLTMSNIWKLRWINLFGASTFATYGFLIEAWPVICLNSFIAVTDVYHLVKMSRKSEFYSLLPLDERPGPYLKHFVEHHATEIGEIFPDFKLSLQGIEGWWILRDMQPAGLFLYSRQSDTEAYIEIDFVAPQFRDMKAARWFFSEGLASLRDTNLKTLKSKAVTPAHRKYLTTLGFRENGEFFVRALDKTSPTQ